MSKMTKSQMIANLSEATGLSKKDTAGFMEKLAEVVYKEVKKTGGIGSLKSKRTATAIIRSKRRNTK